MVMERLPALAAACVPEAVDRTAEDSRWPLGSRAEVLGSPAVDIRWTGVGTPVGLEGGSPAVLGVRRLVGVVGRLVSRQAEGDALRTVRRGRRHIDLRRYQRRYEERTPGG